MDRRRKEFPVVTWMEIRGLPINHWNRVDVYKLMVKFTHIIDIHKDTSPKIKLDCARVKVRCDNLVAIPQQIGVVMGDRLCSIKLKIVQNYHTNSLVGLQGIPITGKISSDQPSIGIVSLLVSNRRSYT